MYFQFLLNRGNSVFLGVLLFKDGWVRVDTLVKYVVNGLESNADD